MQLKLDHVTVCASELESLRQAFADAGLIPDYGGPHANGVTHMALLGFEDGSYLELIAPQKRGIAGGSPWSKLMLADAGACAWAAGTEDIRCEVARLGELGVETTGPTAGSRKRPDGKLIEWELAAVGLGTMGTNLPFLIQDHTPRALRVQTSASVSGCGLSGIEAVVLGVKDLEASITLFQRTYDWESPKMKEHSEFGASVAHFTGTPVMLAAPLGNSSWLTERLAKFGEIPLAYLLRTSDIQSVAKRFHLSGNEEWFGRMVSWFDSNRLRGCRLGVMQS